MPLASTPQRTALHRGGYKLAVAVANLQVQPLECKGPALDDNEEGLAGNGPC